MWRSTRSGNKLDHYWQNSCMVRHLLVPKESWDTMIIQMQLPQELCQAMCHVWTFVCFEMFQTYTQYYMILHDITQLCTYMQMACECLWFLVQYEVLTTRVEKVHWNIKQLKLCQILWNGWTIMDTSWTILKYWNILKLKYIQNDSNIFNYI